MSSSCSRHLRVGIGTRVRLKQPKLGERTWEVTVCDRPSYFECREQAGAITTVAGHRVEAFTTVAPAWP